MEMFKFRNSINNLDKDNHTEIYLDKDKVKEKSFLSR